MGPSLALARLGIVDVVEVTALAGGGWTANQLWVGEAETDRRPVFVKTVSPDAPVDERVAAAAELDGEIGVYRHLDGTGTTPMLLASTDPGDPEGPVLVLERLDQTKARFAPPLMRRPGPFATTVDQIAELVDRIISLPCRFTAPDVDPPRDAQLAYPRFTAVEGLLDSDTLRPAGLDPFRFADGLAGWSAAAQGWDPIPDGVGHLDLHPANVAARSDGTLIAIDWTDLAIVSDDAAHTLPAVLWSPTAGDAARGDGWAGPQTIHPLSAGAAAWFLADNLTAIARSVSGVPLPGPVTGPERVARRRPWIAAICELGACFDLPDLRTGPGRR